MCTLAACRGACCVQGDAGAPLEAEERRTLEEALPAVWEDLLPAAREVIEEKGVWEEDEPGSYATTCVGDAECVFVTYDGPVAKCSLHKAYDEGRLDFPKPISCHLFPVRAERIGEHEVLNVEPIAACAPARSHGCQHGVQLVDMLEEAFERKYGAAWVAAFRTAWKERRRSQGMNPA